MEAAVAEEVQVAARSASPIAFAWHSSAAMRRGLSLLELVLALAISVVVIGLLTMAVNFQLRTFERRRDRIEEAALARAILRHISDDLRSAVAYRPVDLGGLDAVAGNAADSTGLPTDAASGTDPSAAASGESGTPPTGGAASADATATQPTGEDAGVNMASTAAASGAYVAGLYGDQYSLQFDMSRLPRLDEYQAIVLDNGEQSITHVPTDIRTISYYLAGSTPITQASAAQARTTGGLMASSAPLSAQSVLLPPVGQGLVRQDRDRSIASSASLAIDLSDTSQDTGEELLADEVTRLEFRYFDGYSWWPDWDSDVRGGLPMAIEITIALPDRKLASNSPTAITTSLTSLENQAKELFYRLVVRIPTAEPLDPAEAPAATEEAAGASNTASGGAAASSPASGGS